MTATVPFERTSATVGTDAQFDMIARLARQEAGLVIAPEKAPMVFARLGRRMRATGQSDIAAYCRLLESDAGAEERRHLIYALTTNVTSFFREKHHFDYLEAEVLPALSDRLAAGGRVRFWSAGCSTGMEPYSLAMIALDRLGADASGDFRILATDLDPNVLTVARRGRYPAAALDKLPQGYLDRFFRPAADEPDSYDVAPDVRAPVRFRQLNLLEAWPMRGTFDAIFCRNVVIYFDQETQRALWPRFAAACAPGGHIFLGHSERLQADAAHTFTAVATTTYRLDAPSTGADKAESREPASWR